MGMNDVDGGQSDLIFHRRGGLVYVEKPGCVLCEGGGMDAEGERSS